MLDATWQACLDAFLRSLSDRSGSEHTIAAYRSVLIHFFAGSRHPEDVTKQEILDFLRIPFSGRGKEVAPATRNLRITALSSFYAFSSTYMVRGPTGRYVPLFRYASPTLGIIRSKVPKKYHAFSQSELQQFFAAIPDDLRGLRDRALFATLFWTARRVSEIVNLLYGDIFEGMVVDPDGTTRQAWLYRWHGKAMAVGEYDVAELALPAKKAIDAYLERSGRLASIEADDPIFVAFPPRTGGGWPLDPYKPLGRDSAWRRFKVYLRIAELPKSLSPHSLRHTAARMRYTVSPNVREVQQILRHQSIATTDIYLHTLVGTADPVARLLEERYGDLLL